MITFAEPYAQESNVKPEWQLVAQLPGEPKGFSIGVAGSVSGVHQNTLLLAGGANFPDALPWEGGVKKYHDRIIVFVINDGSLKLHQTSFLLPEAVAYSASCTTPLGIFYAGGENQSGLTNKAFILSWDAKQSTIEVNDLPALPQAITNCSAVYINDKIIVAGGDGIYNTSNQVYQLNLKRINEGWSVLTELPKPAANGLLFAFVQDGIQQLVWMGGRRKTPSGVSELFADVYQFNSVLQHWKTLSPLPYPLSAGTGMIIDSTAIVLFGGERGTTFTKVETLLATIAKEQDPGVKINLIDAKNELLKNHPGFSKEILLYKITDGSSTSIGSLPYDVPVTTTASRWSDYIYLPSGEIRAGVRTPNILSVKLNK